MAWWERHNAGSRTSSMLCFFFPCPVWWEIWGSESSEERQKIFTPGKQRNYSWGLPVGTHILASRDNWKSSRDGNLGFGRRSLWDICVSPRRKKDENVPFSFRSCHEDLVFSCNWPSKLRVLLIVSFMASPRPVSDQVDRPNRIADRPP